MDALRTVPLTLAGRRFRITPCAGYLLYQCTSHECTARATHRVLSRATASVEWLCDAHTLAWAHTHGSVGTHPRDTRTGLHVD